MLLFLRLRFLVVAMLDKDMPADLACRNITDGQRAEELELVKERVPDIEKEIFKAPSVKEVQQIARESMDDDNLLNEALQLAKDQGVDVYTTPEQIKKYVQNELISK